ncbi:MAG: hypothetical protein ACTSPL_05500 [Candidatus Odinarchaeia archaeon]
MAIDLLLSLALNLIPVGIFFIPYPFIRKRQILGKVYWRLLICASFFWIFYYLVPGILYYSLKPTLVTTFGTLDTANILSLYFTMSVEFIMNILSFLVSSWPYIFIGAPIISLLILLYKIRGEKKPLKEKLDEISFEYRENPLVLLKKRLSSGDWSAEKNFLKLLIVLLPFSLYLLTGILQMIGAPTQDILQAAETNLGWFLEIFMVYLLLPITAVEILYFTKVSYKGRYIGEKIREEVFYYLLAIGGILSVMSVVLFIQQFPASISTILYFVSYYILASVIFISFLSVFEPISAFLLVKIWGFFKDRLHNSENLAPKNLGERITYGFSIGIGIFLLSLVLEVLIVSIWNSFGVTDPSFFENFTFDKSPSFPLQLILDSNIILSLALQLFGMLVISGAIAFTSKKIQSNRTFSAITAFILAYAFQLTFLFAALQYWITPSPSIFSIGAFEIFTTRTALLRVDPVPAFFYLSVPFYLLKTLATFILFATVFYYWKTPFRIKRASYKNKNLEVVYSKCFRFPSLSALEQSKLAYLFTFSEQISEYKAKGRKLEVYKLMVESGLTFEEMIKKAKASPVELYKILKKLNSKRQIDVFEYELSFPYYMVNLKGLYVVSHDGRILLSYSFSEEASEPVLVAGMLSAISSFIKETTKSRDLLRSIDHGDITLMVEYGKYSFAALLADKETVEMRIKLRQFLNEFEAKYAEQLAEWDGDVTPFLTEKDRVKEFFLRR